MQKVERVNALIANLATRFEEADRDFLMGLNEAQLEKLEPLEAAPVSDPEAAPEVPEGYVKVDALKRGDLERIAAGMGLQVHAKSDDPDPNDVDAWLSRIPSSIANMVRANMARDAAKKEELITALVSLQGSPWSKEELSAKPIEELEKFAVFAKVQPEAPRSVVPRPVRATDGNGEEDGDFAPAPPLHWNERNRPADAN